ncbi:uncharacterized protein An16g03990 [Aspergillus niger]|uniref:Contig An16c0150, genomic contig n=2 Tax=Aspergillus niger TaxID=5061 RepID=A2R7L8_ASPNC|nr:uncharacterized protein An16g03990 [Aspergillus niger]CAK42871.1 unnamed protein product [Aspergillus niger]
MWMTGSFLECGGTGVTGVTAGTRHANVADLESRCWDGGYLRHSQGLGCDDVTEHY